MRLRFLALALLPLFAVGGCASLGTVGTVLGGGVPNPLTPKLAFELHAGFAGGIVVTAAHYNQLPRCPAPAPCSDMGVVTKLRTYINAADGTLKQLDLWAEGNTALDGPALYQAAAIAIDTATKFAASNGVH